LRLRRRLALMTPGLAALIFLRLAVASAASPEDVLVLDPASTQIHFTLVGNLHTVHGNFALRRGTIRFDPETGLAKGEIVIDPASGNSGDKLRDDKMKNDILAVSEFPEISFLPSAVRAHREANGDLRGTIEGVIGLHGESHPQELTYSGNLNGDAVAVTSRFTIPYVQWGLSNPSFLLFRVGDTVEIEIDAVGRVTWAGRAAREQNSLGAAR
jgi:polyisoprenoid-binding protein YceI